MATIADMRLHLIDQYPDSMRWHEKVQKMPTRQVVAIYNKMANRGIPGYVSSYHQIDMFEYLASIEQNHTEVNV